MNEKKHNFGGLFKGLLVLAVAGSGQLSAQDDENVFELSPFEVSAEAGNKLYGVNQSSSGTRIAAVVKELPFTLDILTMDFLDDFHMEDPAEAISAFSNVSANNPNDGSGGGYQVRGFSQWYALRDGFLRNGVMSKTMIDRVEVLKGPYAAIYGRGEPGGVANFIPKTAVYGRNSGETTLQYGQNNTLGFEMEQNIAVSDNTAVLVAGSYFERDFDQEFSYERSKDIGILLRHRLSDKDEIFIDYEHMYRRNNRGNGIPHMKTVWGAPEGIYNGHVLGGNKHIGLWAKDFVEEYGDKNTRGKYMWGERKIESYSIKWLHRFSDNVNLRVSHYDIVQDQPYNFASSMPNELRVDEDLNFVQWVNDGRPTYRDQIENGSGINVDLTVDWNIGESKQTTLFTYDSTKSAKYIWDIGANGSAESKALNGPVADIDRDWGNHSPGTNPELYQVLRDQYEEDKDVEGLFLMHRGSFFDDKLKVMVGARYDDATSSKASMRDSSDPWLATKAVTGLSTGAADDTTYNMGFNYSINPRTIVYASRSTSFNPKGSFYSHGEQEAMPNEGGKGTELGIRTTLFEDNIDIGVNYYVVERNNKKMGNPDWQPSGTNSDGYRNIPSEGDLDQNGLNPLTAEQAQAYEDAYRYAVPNAIPSGLDRVDGFEAFANGRLNDNLSFRASIGTANTEYVRTSTAYLVGEEFNRVPSWTHSLSGRYAFHEGGLKGLALSASYNGQAGFRQENINDLRWNLRIDEVSNLRLAASYSWAPTDKVTHKVALSMDNALGHEGLRLHGYLTEKRKIVGSYTLKY